MPSVSKKQHNFMAAVANNPKFAKKVNVKPSVGEEFMESDKGKKFRTGGLTNPAKGKFNKPRSNHGMMQLPNQSLQKYTGKKDGGIMKAVDKKKNPGLAKLPTEVRNKMGYMKKGGMAHSDISMDKKVVKKAVGMHEKQLHAGKKSDMSKLKSGGMACAPKKMARGGGIETKGKTKGTMIKMNKGGSC
jgi:hypothetical protein